MVKSAAAESDDEQSEGAAGNSLTDLDVELDYVSSQCIISCLHLRGL